MIQFVKSTAFININSAVPFWKNISTHSELPRISNFLYRQYFPVNLLSAISVSYLPQYTWAFIHKNDWEYLFTDWMLRKPRKGVVADSDECRKWLTALWEGHHIVRRSTRVVPSGCVLWIWEDDKTEVETWWQIHRHKLGMTQNTHWRGEGKDRLTSVLNLQPNVWTEFCPSTCRKRNDQVSVCRQNCQSSCILGRGTLYAPSAEENSLM